MSTTTPPDDNKALESGQPCTSPTHFHEDLSRTFGSAAYEWSESDQDAVIDRTVNGFLQSNHHGQQNPIAGAQVVHVGYASTGQSID